MSAFSFFAHWLIGGSAVLIGLAVSMVGAAGVSHEFPSDWLAWVLWIGGAIVAVAGAEVVPI